MEDKVKKFRILAEAVCQEIQTYEDMARGTEGEFNALQGICETAEKLTTHAREELRDYPYTLPDIDTTLAQVENRGQFQISIRTVSEKVCCIRMPPIVPKKHISKKGISANKWYDTMYGNEIARLLYKSDLIGEDLCLWYRHAYVSLTAQCVKDFDNLETKALTDLIVKCLCTDDHPSKFSCYVDAIEADSNYCDIYIMPRKIFGTFYLEQEGG